MSLLLREWSEPELIGKTALMTAGLFYKWQFYDRKEFQIGPASLGAFEEIGFRAFVYANHPEEDRNQSVNWNVNIDRGQGLKVRKGGKARTVKRAKTNAARALDVLMEEEGHR